MTRSPDALPFSADAGEGRRELPTRLPTPAVRRGEDGARRRVGDLGESSHRCVDRSSKAAAVLIVLPGIAETDSSDGLRGTWVCQRRRIFSTEAELELSALRRRGLP